MHIFETCILPVKSNLLTSDAGWDTATQGCDYILHVASPFTISEPKCPDDLIRPAVDGTLRVLRAASQLTVPPKRVVVTSSTVAITEGHSKETFNDDDWSCLEQTKIPVNSYGRSKTLAERVCEIFNPRQKI